MANAIMLVWRVEDSLAEEGLKAETFLRKYRVMRNELSIHVVRHLAINWWYIISV